MKPILLLLAIYSSSCSLNRVPMKEYFSHIHKSGKYEVKEIINGNRALLRYYKDTINVSDKVKKDDVINVKILQP